MLTVATMSINRQMKILQTRRTADYISNTKFASYSKQRNWKVRADYSFRFSWFAVMFYSRNFHFLCFLCSPFFRCRGFVLSHIPRCLLFIIVLFPNTATDGVLLHSHFITIPSVVIPKKLTPQAGGLRVNQLKFVFKVALKYSANYTSLRPSFLVSFLTWHAIAYIVYNSCYIDLHRRADFVWIPQIQPLIQNGSRNIRNTEGDCSSPPETVVWRGIEGTEGEGVDVNAKSS